jgi:hypothetical protein
MQMVVSFVGVATMIATASLLGLISDKSRQ